MLQDNRIIQRHRAHAVIAESQSVPMRGGSFIQLHLVQKNGVDDTYLRAVLYDDSHWFVFDLRAIDKAFAVDIPALPRRDTPGLVMHTLRAKCEGAEEFYARVLHHSVDVWLAGGMAQVILKPQAPVHAPPADTERRAAA